MCKAVIAILVENNAGVLSRITGLFGRRGYNIDSLTVTETNDPTISRITVTTRGEENVIDQILLQTEKLIECKAVSRQMEDECIQRELLLIKLRARHEERCALREICEIYKADIVDLSPDSLVIELTGKPSKINGFMEMMSGYDILESCRTGVTSIDRGSRTLQYEKEESAFTAYRQSA